MQVKVQHLTSIVRIWLSDDSEYGDPYDWSATVQWHNDHTIELLGVDKPVTKEMWTEMQDAFFKMGITEVIAKRYTGGQERVRIIKTKRKKDRG